MRKGKGMDLEAVLKLGPGRELDAAVAVYVFGHKNVRLVPDHPWGCLRDNTPEEEAEDRKCGVKNEYRPVPDYSEYVSDAWSVFLNVCDRLFSVRRCFFDELQAMTTHTPPGCSRPVTVAWPDVLVVLRDRLPECICKAALVAVAGGRKT